MRPMISLLFMKVFIGGAAACWATALDAAAVARNVKARNCARIRVPPVVSRCRGLGVNSRPCRRKGRGLQWAAPPSPGRDLSALAVLAMAICAFDFAEQADVSGRNKPGHDES